MDPPLRCRLEPEVLHRVRDVGVPAVDVRVGQRLVQQAPGRADERLALAVLLVAGLLTDEDDPGGLGALAEHGLGGRLPQLAGPAAGRGLAQPGQAHPDRRLRRVVLAAHALIAPEWRPFRSPGHRYVAARPTHRDDTR